MKLLNPTDTDPLLAVAIGRFSQASAALEHAILYALIRVLPLTDDMGLAIFADNTMRQNLDSLERLLKLPDTAVDQHWRGLLLEKIPKVKQSTEDRNRLMHSPLIQSGDPLVGGLYSALIHRKGNRVSMAIDAATITAWAEEASEHAAWFRTVPHGQYNTADWEHRFPEYQSKDWPQRKK